MLAAVLALGVLLGLFSLENAESGLYVMDVGQGDAMLIRTPAGHNVLIDGGPDSRVADKLGRVLPFWDKTMDLMVLTHAHADHVAGLNAVLERYEVEEALDTGLDYRSPAYQAWLSGLEERGIPLTVHDGPRTYDFGTEEERCALEILAPFHSLEGMEVENINDTSIVSRLDCGGVVALLMGDAEEEQEHELLRAEIDLSADILKAGHHGSDTSSSLEFIRAVDPETVLISVGEENSFGHPSARTLHRLERERIEVRRTDLEGDIFIPFGTDRGN